MGVKSKLRVFYDLWENLLVSENSNKYCRKHDVEDIKKMNERKYLKTIIKLVVRHKIAGR